MGVNIKIVGGRNGRDFELLLVALVLFVVGRGHEFGSVIEKIVFIEGEFLSFDLLPNRKERRMGLF